jgi:membrane-bound lytic murein transglycosylase A
VDTLWPIIGTDDFEVQMRRGTVVVALAVAALFGGCRARLQPTVSEPLVEAPRPPAIADDGDRAALDAAIRRSLEYYRRLPREETFAFGSKRVTVADMEASLDGLLAVLAGNPPADRLAAEIRSRFVIHQAVTPGEARFTGYYVPTLEARLTPDAEFRFPILARPPDLITVETARFGDAACRGDLVGRVDGGRLVPYFTRAEIESGVTAAPVLAWARDPVDLAFLQIQGSGTLALPGGTRHPIGFAATNGHKYVSIGKVLADRGALTIDGASQAAIRDWVAAHPAEGTEVLHANPRYVFFRPHEGPAVGSLGVPVTAGRSIATDPALYPPGALAFIRLPAKGGTPELARLVLNQDKGGAIRGPGRVDLFFGSGDEAGAAAGRFKAQGDLYFLAPRTAVGG